MSTAQRRGHAAARTEEPRLPPASLRCFCFLPALPQVFLRACLRGALLALLLLAALPGLLLAQEAAPPAAALADYTAALAAARSHLTDAKDEGLALAAARAELAPFAAVELPGGDVITLAPLLGDGAAPLTRRIALARVTTALEQLRRAGDDQTAARLALLDQVWLQPEFNRGETWGERFWRWLSELLDRFLPDVQPNPAAQQAALTTTELAGWAIAAVALVVLAWLLSLWLRRLLGRFVADAAVAPDEEGAALPRTPAEARERAEALARTGAYRDAVRNLYLAALLALEKRRLVAADRSLTNRELLAQAPAESAIRPLLQPVVDTFDAVWYGVQEPDEVTFAGYSAQIDALEKAATAGENRPT